MVFIAAGFIDILQWVLIPFVVADEIADPIIGIGILGYFQARDVSIITKPKRVISLMGSYLGEAFTDSIAPAWIFDIWYIYWDVKREDAIFANQKIQEENNNDYRRPLYEKGRREPIGEIYADGKSAGEEDLEEPARNPNTRPLVVGGVRRPS